MWFIFCFNQIFINMRKKLIISENQLLILKNYICEQDAHETIIKRITDDLNLNYEPSKGTFKKGGEYHEESMILNKVNQELMTAKSLVDYFHYKHKLSVEFLKQIINDWFNGNLNNDNNLSRNVSI